MKNKVKVNTNRMCKIKLTPFGIGVLICDNQPAYESNLDKQTHILTMELWSVMNTFGKYLFNGAINLPFENNEITIVVD